MPLGRQTAPRDVVPELPTRRLGARLEADGDTITFRVYSAHATRIEVWIYGRPRDADELVRVTLRRAAGQAEADIWSGAIGLGAVRANSDPGDAVYYGLRAWGPNWPVDPAWQPGSERGFQADVDLEGNRFNPNKLLLDPYALEVSHDPAPRLSSIDPNEPSADYDTGPEHRAIDTGRIAPKSVLPLHPLAADTGVAPRRPLRDDVIYEAHVRGLTRLDPSVPESLRGTYAGAALKAGYLRDLGVTAVEFLPVQHFAGEQNDDGDPRGDNYWGYMTLGYLAPNRRFAADRSPGGPTREFKAMVRAFHDVGIKVFLDVVLNHTAEGLLARTTEGDDSRSDDTRQVPDRARLLSFRGLDNATYYTLRSRPDLDGGRTNQRYLDNSGCGPALAVARPAVRDFVLDVLGHWVREMGVDGFRFDLAPTLGNRLPGDGFAFDWSDPESLLAQLGRRLPLRTDVDPGGVDLIAEPWLAQGEQTYLLGRFPPGWAEWNDVYRQVLRRAENKLNVRSVRPWELANALSGSEQQFRPQAPPGAVRGPSASINYVSSHDGLTLRDLVSRTDDEDAWDHGGDPVAQRQAVRNLLAVLAVSAGVPMLQGGDEVFRSLGGRRNTVAADDASTWLPWDGVAAFVAAEQAGDAAALARLRERDDVRVYSFARAMLRFRAAHPGLRPAAYLTGGVAPGGSLPDLGWYGADGRPLGSGWDDPEAGFLGVRVAEPAGSVFVAYLWRDQPLDVALPAPLSADGWRRVADTAAWMEPIGNVDASPGAQIAARYWMHPRSVVVLVEG
ncbi:MAG TPA: alpha-amylase family glycosyl hydrolase [Kineosporiaceae bacterium]